MTRLGLEFHEQFEKFTYLPTYMKLLCKSGVIYRGAV